MKRGFTLAEALITLSIIGVIAAITLPSVNSNLWKTQRKALYRKMYAKLENALDLSVRELGYTPQCGYWSSSGYNPESEAGYTMKSIYGGDGITTKWERGSYLRDENGEYILDEDGEKIWKKAESQSSIGGDANGLFSDCDKIGALMEKHLGVVRKCDYNNDESCGPKYAGMQDLKRASLEANPDSNDLKNSAKEKFPDKDFDDLTSEEKETLMNYTVNRLSSGTGMSNTVVNRIRYYLHDGTVILALVNHNTTASFYPRYFAVDTNGDKGPNKWGQDVFYLLSYLSKDLKTNYIYDATGGYTSQSHSGLPAVNGAKLME